MFSVTYLVVSFGVSNCKISEWPTEFSEVSRIIPFLEFPYLSGGTKSIIYDCILVMDFSLTGKEYSDIFSPASLFNLSSLFVSGAEH